MMLYLIWPLLVILLFAGALLLVVSVVRWASSERDGEWSATEGTPPGETSARPPQLPAT
jgi:hypothetical protein